VAAWRPDAAPTAQKNSKISTGCIDAICMLQAGRVGVVIFFLCGRLLRKIWTGATCSEEETGETLGMTGEKGESLSTAKEGRTAHKGTPSGGRQEGSVQRGL
jgi:hypothetical protein